MKFVIEYMSPEGYQMIVCNSHAEIEVAMRALFPEYGKKEMSARKIVKLARAEGIVQGADKWARIHHLGGVDNYFSFILKMMERFRTLAEVVPSEVQKVIYSI